jgi:hypothetical protein
MLLGFKSSKNFNKETFEDFLRDIINATRCKEVWIPRSVKEEFLVKAKRERKRRKRFIDFLKKIFQDFDIKLKTCPIYDINRIIKIAKRYNLELGESDALNQAFVLIENRFMLRNRHLGIRKIAFLTNDKNVRNVKVESLKTYRLALENHALKFYYD